MNITQHILLACIFFLSAPFANALEPTPQQAALYFAGLDAPATNVERKSFQKHTKSAWANYEKRIGLPLQAWAKQEVAYPGGNVVFYPFSGPDFLTVERMYPNAGRYVLVALQKALRPTPPESMDETQRLVFEKKLDVAWNKFGRLGYFRTEDMDEDQHDKNASLGMTTILMAFAARLGYEVLEVSPLGFNTAKGEWEPLPANEPQWKSVRLSLQKDGRKVTLDYISMDLSDDGLRAQKHLRSWMKQMAGNPTLLKAASHLLQEPYFEILRNMLVSTAPVVVQDETGLEYTDLRKIGEVKLYGNFIKPQVLFKTTKQLALAAAYKAEKSPGALPFAFSYLKDSEARSLQLARRQSPATQAPNPAPAQPQK